MRNRKTAVVGLLAWACSLLSGGCVEAIQEGALAGVSDGIAALIEGIITSTAEGLSGGD